jgi:hypothetical protein
MMVGGCRRVVPMVLSGPRPKLNLRGRNLRELGDIISHCDFVEQFEKVMGTDIVCFQGTPQPLVAADMAFPLPRAMISRLQKLLKVSMCLVK